MLPGRLGLRFALEALFLVLLAIGLGLAGLRTSWIVLVMAIGWLLVALIEFTAERISTSPLSYLLPERVEPAAGEPEASWPMPEERTVVAPPPERPLPEPEPEPEATPQPELPEATPQPELPEVVEPSEEELARPRRLRPFLRRREPDGEPAVSEPEASRPMPEERTVVAPPPERPSPEPEPEPEATPQPELPEVVEPSEEERARPGRLRSFLRRREPDGEPAVSEPPRHVKLLPRRSAPQSSRAAQEVAELFDDADEPEGPSA